MTTTILLVGHGSRNQAGNDEIREFQQQWQAQHPDWRIDLCYIELADVLLPEGLQRAAQGSDRVIVVPLIISAAGHVKMEIPEHIEEARAQFPDVEFIYAPHLGSNETLLAILQNSSNQRLNHWRCQTRNHWRDHFRPWLIGQGCQRRTGETGALAV